MCIYYIQAILNDQQKTDLIISTQSQDLNANFSLF